MRLNLQRNRRNMGRRWRSIRKRIQMLKRTMRTHKRKKKTRNKTRKKTRLQLKEMAHRKRRFAKLVRENRLCAVRGRSSDGGCDCAVNETVNLWGVGLLTFRLHNQFE